MIVGLGVVVVLLLLAAERPMPSPLERRLVGQWFTTHGNVDTTIVLRPDHTVTVAQAIRLALPGGQSRAVGPIRTTGEWRVENGRLLLATSASGLATPWWRKVRRLAETHRWLGDGALHRDWALEAVAGSRIDFIDRGSGERSCAVKCAPALAASEPASAPIEPALAVPPRAITAAD